MTKLSAYWLMLFLCVGTAGYTMAQFEGIIESRNTTIDEAGQLQEFTMTMYIGPNMAMIRTSPFGSSPGSTMIYRGDMKVMWMLNEEDHTYFEIGHDEEPDRMFVPSDGSGKPDIKKTGKSKQVLGYKCDQIVIRESDRETEMWATKSLGNLYQTLSSILGTEEAEQGWESQIMRMGYYPLIARTKVEGKVLESQEVTRIEKKKLDAGLFEVPEGFSKQKSVDMMK